MVVVLAEKKDQAKKLATPFDWREKDGFIEVGKTSHERIPVVSLTNGESSQG
ncbi:hypothetical protein [Brevibacillus formosus]|uniref:hypothetical protein n=1 Tax=Brevibacillus formosus TaxID=54913 RepID=UPI003F1DB2D2